MALRTRSNRCAGVVLLVLLAVALAQPLATPAAEPETSFVVTSARQILGTWTWKTGVNYLSFGADGTLREARTMSDLETAPYAISAYGFEDAVMLVTEREVSGVPSCGDTVGRYEAHLHASGGLEIVAIDDACGPRAASIATVYEPTEPFVLVTSAEQVVGTWRTASTYHRFDEDGTFRSAWSIDDLESAPYAVNTFEFERSDLLVREVEVRGVPTCGDAVGRYQARLLENGDLMILRIEDPCGARGRDMQRIYEPVE